MTCWKAPSAIAAGLCVGVAIAAPALTQPALQTYKARSFSIQYPKGWRAEQSDTDYIIVTNYQPRPGNDTAPLRAIKTDAALIEDTFPSQLAGVREGGDVWKEESVTVGGLPAYRLWTKSGGWAFPNTVVTLIPYSQNKTAFVATYYTASNPKALEAIRQIHGSFRFAGTVPRRSPRPGAN